MTDVSTAHAKKGNTARRLTSLEAIDIAKAAIEELNEGNVGQHLGTHGRNRLVVTHRFQASVKGYPGWEWHIVLATAPGTRSITINEIALMPGDGALQAPAWVPYHDRVQQGDLGPNDYLPPRADDPRLEDTSTLSVFGVRRARDRIRKGARGKGSEYAKAADHECHSCAFYVPLQTPLETNGACTNEYAFAGEVVAQNYGCGAHSLTPPVQPGAQSSVVFDDEATLELHFE